MTSCIYNRYTSREIGVNGQRTMSVGRPEGNRKTQCLRYLLCSVQWRFAKRLPGYSTLDYLTRLKSLEQCSLEKRHIVHDLVLTYKIVLGLLMFGRQISLHCAWNDAAPTRDNSCKVLLNVSRIKVIRHFLLNELLVSGIVCHLPSLILEVCRLSRELSITLMWFYLHDIDVLYGFITCIVSLFIFTACAFL